MVCWRKTETLIADPDQNQEKKPEKNRDVFALFGSLRFQTITPGSARRIEVANPTPRRPGTVFVRCAPALPAPLYAGFRLFLLFPIEPPVFMIIF